MKLKHGMLSITRVPFRSLAYMAIILLACITFVVGASIFLTTTATINQLNDSFTTVAIENIDYINNTISTSWWGDIDSSLDTLSGWNAYEYSNPAASEKIREHFDYEKMLETVRNSEYAITAAHGKAMSGTSAAVMRPVIQSEIAQGKAGSLYDAPYYLGALDVICTEILFFDQSLMGAAMTTDGTMDRLDIIEYSVECVVNSAYGLPESYPICEKIIIKGFYVYEKYSMENPFTVGNRYLVWGKISEELSTDVSFTRYMSMRLGYHDLDFLRRSAGGESSRYYYCDMVVVDENFPEIINLSTGGEEAKEAKTRVIDFVETNSSSFPVIAIDNIEAIFQFHQDNAIISKGEFLPENINTCLVNEVWAETNGIEIGDTLEIDLYDSVFCPDFYPDAWQTGVWWTHSPPMYNGNPRIESNTYTVTGMYRMPLFIRGDFTFSPNTVFVPSGSVSGEYVDYIPVVTGIILKNGYIDEFEAELEEAGFENCYLYFDKGYGSFAEAIAKIKANSDTVAIICVAAWITIITGVLALMITKRRAEIGIMISLGTTKGGVLGIVLIGTLLITLIGSALGTIVSYLVFDKVAQAIWTTESLGGAFSGAQVDISKYIEQYDKTGAILLCACIQAFVCCALAIAMTYRQVFIAPRRLMTRDE